MLFERQKFSKNIFGYKKPWNMMKKPQIVLEILERIEYNLYEVCHKRRISKKRKDHHG